MSLDFTISLCFTCQHKKICKHYKYFRDNEDIAVNIKECDNFIDKNTNSKVNSTTIPLNPADKIIRPNTVEMPGILTQPRTFPPLTKGDPFKPATSTFMPPANITKVEIAKGVCDRCKQEVLVTDLDNCVECGRPVCKDCGVYALEDGKGVFTCEKCWSGTPDPDPNEKPEKVSITYGEENKSWDLKDFEDKEQDGKETGGAEDERDKQVGTKKSNRKSVKK